MAEIFGAGSINGLKVNTGGSGQVGIYDLAGNPLDKSKFDLSNPIDKFLPVGGVGNNIYRALKTDFLGGLASSKSMSVLNYQLFTAALPPTWTANLATMTVAHSVTSGTLLNASAIGTSATSAVISSFASIQKYQRSPIYSKTRARLIKGGNNGVAEIGGFSSTQNPGIAINPNGVTFLFGIDGTLKPTVYGAGTTIAQGVDFAALINSANYYSWDIIVDYDGITFIVQDPSTGLIVNEQTLKMASGDPRVAYSPFFFSYSRVYVPTGLTNVGLATQVYISDISVSYLDIDNSKPWPHASAANGLSALINPTVALAQVANYTNNAAPISATLSNTTAGYTTLGGQFQFASIVGAETDYALFAFTVPTGLRLNVTGINIDTLNTGAAVATTANWLQWFLSADSVAATLASNTFRAALGNQVFPVGAAIGAQASQLNYVFSTPYVANSGRTFHIGFKMPFGTATPSQIIRGTVRVEGYFD
jgi:hypothetical protein